MLSGMLLIAVSGTLAVSGEHSLITGSSPASFLSLALGLLFGLTFPCCAPRPKLGFLQSAAFTVVVLHCLLDGHIVRESKGGWLIALVVAHKFQDGADLRLVSGNSVVTQSVGRIALILATPIGLLCIPESAVDPAVHASLFAAIIGLNLGSAFHLFRHAARIGTRQPTTC